MPSKSQRSKSSSVALPVLFWSLEDQSPAKEIKEWLSPALPKGLRLKEEGPVEFRTRYLDTQDWRLRESERVLVHRQGAGSQKLLCWEFGSGEFYAEQGVRKQPVLPEDLPYGVIGRHLPQWLDLRGLISMRTTIDTCRTGRVVDAEGKTVLMLEVHAERIGRKPLSPWLWLRPVRGYRAEAKLVSRNLDRKLKLHPLPQDPLLNALKGGPRQVADYSSKLTLKLDPEERADQAARYVLLTLLDAVEANVSGTRKRIDTEFLHDLRVAVRRSRSFLQGVKGVLPEVRIGRFMDGLRWLQGITGEGRDLDVYLLDFDQLQSRLSDEQAMALLPFRSFLEQRLKQAYLQLSKDLADKRFKYLMQDWRDYLNSPVPYRSPLPNAMRSIDEVARLRITKAWKRVLTEGSAITRSSPAEDLHDLRKRCKRLRYLMEFFRSLFEEAAIGSQIKALKRLQEVLGDFQDREVQHDSILSFKEAMAEAGQLPEETAQAMDALAQGFMQDQNEIRENFYSRFAEFAAKGERKAFQKMLESRA